MNYKKAIMTRVSRRSYTSELPSIEKVLFLREEIERINKEENLSIQLMIDESNGFGGIAGYGMFKGVRNYVALIGSARDPFIDEKLGYFGERILLLCETLGLGTCWVGGTFDKKKCRCKVADDEVFRCAIVFGNVKTKTTPRENAIRNGMHKVKKRKAIMDLFYSEEEPPNWFIEGMKMVQRAPSARNKMPVFFYYSGGNVTARIKEPTIMNYYDLGIAKLHFEIGAQNGHFEFGNGGHYILD